MTSIATLQYGLTVRALGFITAAYAWKSLEPTFSFFDLLFLRKRQDTLVVKNKNQTQRSFFEKVPEEIWGGVRKIVVDEVLRMVEWEILNDWRCYCIKENCFCHSPPKDNQAEILDQQHSKYYYKSLMKLFDDFCIGEIEAFKPIHRLLSYFGLAHPLTRFIPLNPDDSLDFDSVALIALPARTDIGSHTTISGEHSQIRDQHTIVDVSLKLPLDADSRFVRFIRLFNLQVVSTSISTLRVTNQAVLEDQEQEEGKDDDSEKHGQKKKLRNKIAPLAGLKGLKNEEEVETKEIKPGWKLYTACDAGF